MARLEITSLAFMLDCVPEPVCHTASGKWASSFAVDDLLRRRDDGLADLFIEQAHCHVGLGRGALDDAQRAHDRQRLLLPPDLEIAKAALGLRAPVAVGGNLDGSERVGLGAGLGHVSRSRG